MKNETITHHPNPSREEVETLLKQANGCSGCQKKLPSNWQMFKNLVGSVGAIIQEGLEQRTSEEIGSVLKICAECPKVIKDNDHNPNRCGECGCFLKAKTAIKAWHCPIGKW